MLQEKQNYFIRLDTKNFVDGKTQYRCSSCGLKKFIDNKEYKRIFLTTLEKNPPTEKKLFSNIKSITSDKPWVTEEIKQLVAQKYRYFKDYKLTQSAKSFLSIKKYCNLENRNLKEAQNKFSVDFFLKLKPQKRVKMH